jgi:hypothetical protein
MPATFALLGIELPDSIKDFDVTAEYPNRIEAQAALDGLHALGVKGGDIIELEDTTAPISSGETDSDAPAKM